MSRTEITTAKAIYPQIYAYTLPTVTDKQGWVKIGYTENQVCILVLKSRCEQ